MYQFLLRWMKPGLAQCVMVLVYSGLLLALWLRWPIAAMPGFRYGQM